MPCCSVLHHPVHVSRPCPLTGVGMGFLRWDMTSNLQVNPNPPKGVVEMAEQGIRDPEERLSR